MSKTRPVAKPNPPEGSASDWAFKVFPALFGALLALALLKFPNPGIMAKFIEPPQNAYEWALSSWPTSIGYGLLVAVLVVGLIAGFARGAAPKSLVILPALWFFWQLMAATQSVNAQLTRLTLEHFLACAVCFYLGLFCLGRQKSLSGFFGLLLAAMGLVILAGWEQRFGGLEGTRNYFHTYLYNDWLANRPEQIADYLKRISSNRIFSTLFYPNALAGALLLWMPVVLVTILKNFTLFERSARIFLALLMGCGALACLFWSGSKGGWLLALGLGVIALLYSSLPKKIKLGVVVLVVVGGLSGFALKYAGYFERKATSVSARFDYWQAAVKTAAANPVFGTGPGTFAIPYQKMKRPESEMARLTHNDYLQQASDSGLIGFLAYTGFMGWALFWARPRFGPTLDPIRFAVWLGLLGWALQGFIEFGLYIPALSWGAFAMLGWLLATHAKPVDNPPPAAYSENRR